MGSTVYFLYLAIVPPKGLIRAFLRRQAPLSDLGGKTGSTVYFLYFSPTLSGRNQRHLSP